MKIKRLQLTLLLLLAVACQPVSSTAVEPVSTPIESVSPIATATSMPLATIATRSITAQATQDLITPRLINICPQQRTVSLSDLDLSATTRLLVKRKGDSTNAVWTLSKVDETFAPIAGLAPTPQSYIKIDSISPDRKWLAYSVGQVGLNNAALWIGSVDGEVQREILPGVESYGNFVSWLDDETIMIIGQPDNREEPTPTVVLSPFNGGQAFLPPLPEDSIFLGYGLTDKQPSAIYFDGKWKLFNYHTGSVQNVFPWLDNEEWLKDYYVLKTGFSINMVGGTIDLQIATPYGLDVALGLTPSASYADYAAIMHKIVLPGENVKTRILGWNKNLVFLERYDDRVDRQNVLFYALDMQDEELYDYCFDRSDAITPFVVSADGRFLAWSKHSNPYEVVIFAVETGKVALLSDVELIGWGEVKAQ